MRKVCGAIRSHEGLTRETSPQETLYGGQFTLLNYLNTISWQLAFLSRGPFIKKDFLFNTGYV